MRPFPLMGSLLAGPALATVPILTEVSLKGCADVSCPAGAVRDLVGESNCTLGGSVLRRVGIAPEVLDVPIDDNNVTDIRKLSITVATLQRGGPAFSSSATSSSSSSSNWMRKQVYTQSYFLGAPAGLNLSSPAYPKGCALIFQHLFQTLPIAHEVRDDDTTDCSPWLQQSCMDEITGYVDDFRANHTDDRDRDQAPRCQDVAAYLEERTRSDKSFHCNLIAGAVNITGVETIGPGAPSEPARDAGPNNGCHPTLPSSYELMKLADVELILDRDGSTTTPTGGLDGYTPVMSVLFDKLLYSQWICMKTMGEFDNESTGARSTPVIAGLVMGAATLITIMMT